MKRLLLVASLTCLASITGGPFWPSTSHAYASAADADSPQALGTALFDRACLLFARGEAEKDTTARHLGQVLFGRAIPYLERARGEDPTSKDLINNLAAAYGATGKTDEAIALLRFGFERHPKDATLAFNYGMALLEGGKRAEARRHLDVLRKLDPRRAEMFEAVIERGGGAS